MSKYLHTFGQYRDGYQWIDFCRLCGAEGQQLWSDCPGAAKSARGFLCETSKDGICKAENLETCICLKINA